MLDQASLMQVAKYDPQTGLFSWLHGKKGRRTNKPAGSTMTNGYKTIAIDGKDYLAHRLAWLYVYGVWPSGVIDHINGIRNDNRIENLRDVTQVENMQNVHKPRSDNTTGFRGVSVHKGSGKFTARLLVNGRYKSLGLHATAELASKAYLDAKRANGMLPQDFNFDCS